MIKATHILRQLSRTLQNMYSHHAFVASLTSPLAGSGCTGSKKMDSLIFCWSGPGNGSRCSLALQKAWLGSRIQSVRRRWSFPTMRYQMLRTQFKSKKTESLPRRASDERSYGLITWGSMYDTAQPWIFVTGRWVEASHVGQHRCVRLRCAWEIEEGCWNGGLWWPAVSREQG